MKLYTCASLLMMAALLFASCSDAPAETVDTAAAADTTAAVETVTEARWKDAIPEGTGYTATGLSVGFNISQASAKASAAEFIKVN